MTTKYELHLDGVRALDLPLALFREVIDFIIDGAARSARLAGEGRSTARGSAPVWLADAADVHLVGFRGGSLSMDVAAKPLWEIAPTVFAHETQSTSVDLLIEAVDDAAHGRRDSERLDAGVLEPLRELLGTDVVLEGTVAFTPSGKPQRIEVDHVAGARAGDVVWRRIPRGSLPHEQLALPTGDIGAIIGRWPGDEDDARILAALAEIS